MSGREEVEGSGDQLLARPTFARHQNGCCRRPDSPDELEDAPHGRVGSHDPHEAWNLFLLGTSIQGLIHLSHLAASLRRRGDCWCPVAWPARTTPCSPCRAKIL